jgi:DASH complex subunit DAD2
VLPPTNTAAAAAKLLEKKKEFDAVSALERASALYLERIEGIGDDCDIMADAGQGKVIYRMKREPCV